MELNILSEVKSILIKFEETRKNKNLFDFVKEIEL